MILRLSIVTRNITITSNTSITKTLPYKIKYLLHICVKVDQCCLRINSVYLASKYIIKQTASYPQNQRYTKLPGPNQTFSKSLFSCNTSLIFIVYLSQKVSLFLGPHAVSNATEVCTHSYLSTVLLSIIK